MDFPNGTRFEQSVPHNTYTMPDGTQSINNPTIMLAEELQLAVGYYVICDFLIGTQLLETRDGILNLVGVNFLVLYQPNLDCYIVCDLYALKFITVYNSTEVPSTINTQR